MNYSGTTHSLSKSLKTLVLLRVVGWSENKVPYIYTGNKPSPHRMSHLSNQTLMLLPLLRVAKEANGQ
jgi:hypothetical protein